MTKYQSTLAQQGLDTNSRGAQKTKVRYLANMLAEYKNIEKLCDEATNDLEELGRRIENRDSQAEINRAISTSQNQRATDPEASDSKSALNRFLANSKIARKFQVPYRVFGVDKVISEASEKDLEQMEVIEISISMYLFSMRELEAEILEYLPTTFEEVSAKLKFISCLLIDGHDLDLDVYAYVVREAAEQIEFI